MGQHATMPYVLPCAPCAPCQHIHAHLYVARMGRRRLQLPKTVSTQPKQKQTASHPQ